jgi:hypothetical protein
MDMEKQTPELLRDKEVHSNAYIAISVDQKLFYLGLAIVGYLDRGVLSPQFPVVAVMVPYLQPELLQAVPLLWNCVMKYDVATGDCSHQLFYISEDKLEYCVTALAGGLRVRGDVDTCVSSHTLVHQRNRGCKALDNTSLELGEALKMFNVLVPWLPDMPVMKLPERPFFEATRTGPGRAAPLEYPPDWNFNRVFEAVCDSEAEVTPLLLRLVLTALGDIEQDANVQDRLLSSLIWRLARAPRGSWVTFSDCSFYLTLIDRLRSMKTESCRHECDKDPRIQKNQCRLLYFARQLMYKRADLLALFPGWSTLMSAVRRGLLGVVCKNSDCFFGELVTEMTQAVVSPFYHTSEEGVEFPWFPLVPVSSGAIASENRKSSSLIYSIEHCTRSVAIYPVHSDTKAVTDFMKFSERNPEAEHVAMHEVNAISQGDCVISALVMNEVRHMIQKEDPAPQMPMPESVINHYNASTSGLHMEDVCEKASLILRKSTSAEDSRKRKASVLSEQEGQVLKGPPPTGYDRNNVLMTADFLSHFPPRVQPSMVCLSTISQMLLQSTLDQPNGQKKAFDMDDEAFQSASRVFRNADKILKEHTIQKTQGKTDYEIDFVCNKQLITVLMDLTTSSLQRKHLTKVAALESEIASLKEHNYQLQNSVKQLSYHDVADPSPFPAFEDSDDQQLLDAIFQS